MPPQGRSKGPIFNEKFQAAFNTSLCSIRLVDGHLVPRLGGNCPNPAIQQIHGFFHITNLGKKREDFREILALILR